MENGKLTTTIGYGSLVGAASVGAVKYAKNMSQAKNILKTANQELNADEFLKLAKKSSLKKAGKAAAIVLGIGAAATLLTKFIAGKAKENKDNPKA